MKLRTQRENLTGDDIYFESMDYMEHDAACAHALIQAMNEIFERKGAPDTHDNALDDVAWITRRADTLMAEWGFNPGALDSSEVGK